jgi:hypothetical protein
VEAEKSLSNELNESFYQLKTSSGVKNPGYADGASNGTGRNGRKRRRREGIL